MVAKAKVKGPLKAKAKVVAKNKPLVLSKAKDAKTKDTRDAKDMRIEARPRKGTGIMANKSAQTEATPRAAIVQSKKTSVLPCPLLSHG